MTGSIAPRILHAGESCLVVEFGGAIDLGVNARVQALRKRVEASPFPGIYRRSKSAPPKRRRRKAPKYRPSQMK